jgi:DNA (cytosine-5)-methyltransferase 1
MRDQIKVIDLFAGVGGLSYGFAHNENFKIVAANEILQPMAKSYELNHKNIPVYCKDIRNFSYKDIKNDLDVKTGEIDIVVGGPPCQAYSTVGKRLIDDPRGFLFQEYFRILKEIKPRFFLFENVKGLISMSNGELLPTIVELFNSLGYNVQYKVLNAADYGTPQTRERIIITGSLFSNKFVYPSPTHYNPLESSGIEKNSQLIPYLTLQDALSDLPLLTDRKADNKYRCKPINSFQEKMRLNSSDFIEEHILPVNSDFLMKIMDVLPQGGTPKDIPEEFRPKSGFGNSYSRLWWDRPSTTITRNLGTPSSARCIHPLAPRALTTREGARLQGFPDNYKFVGSRSVKNLQIGNAVPTILSEALVKSILKHFNFL